jgi:hypothetical protein
MEEMDNNSNIMPEGANSTYKLIPVEKLKIDKYQRLLNQTLGGQIAAAFSFNKVGVITVSYREGIYNVIDGQHRVYGATLAKVPALMCQIYNDLTYQQEAKLFNDLNGIRKKITAYDIYNADIEAGNAETLEIKKCVVSNGFKIDRSKGDGVIISLSRLHTIYKTDGYNHLDNTLKCIKDIWEGIGSSLTGKMLMGMSTFLTTYGSKINRATFISQLRLVEPYKIKREIESDTSEIQVQEKFSNVIIKYYNSRLPYDHKIFKIRP